MKDIKYNDLATVYAKAKQIGDGWVQPADGVYNQSQYGQDRTTVVRDYSFDEMQRIINSNSLEAQQRLSRNYYDKDGFYKRIILYYATLLTYSGLLIPHVKNGQQLSTPNISKRYYGALEFLDKINLNTLLVHISQRVLIYGRYYGIVNTLAKDQLILFDLPTEFCRTRYSDLNGLPIVEFNIGYFNTITDEAQRDIVLKSYPKLIQREYKKSKGAAANWVLLPTDVGICFSFFDDGRPLFLDTIPATVRYDQAVDNEHDRELEDIHKIIVQTIPHLNDGQLLFEPPEAMEIHNGTVNMLKGNKNVSVLTTYGQVEGITSKNSNESSANGIERMLQNMYAKTGVSSQLFAATGTQSLNSSIVTDINLMKILSSQYDKFMSRNIDTLFSNGNIYFKYMILPVTEYTRSDYIVDAMKLAQCGYSFLLPAAAMGLNQHDITSLKDLENDLLNLHEKFIPLSSSYTESAAEEVGAPTKTEEDKAAGTIANEESLDNQGSNE